MCTTAGGNRQPRWQPTTAGDAVVTVTVTALPVILGFSGTGMMVERLKHEGTSHSSSDLLKICVKMGAS